MWLLSRASATAVPAGRAAPSVAKEAITLMDRVRILPRPVGVLTRGSATCALRTARPSPPGDNGGGNCGAAPASDTWICSRWGRVRMLRLRACGCEPAAANADGSVRRARGRSCGAAVCLDDPADDGGGGGDRRDGARGVQPR